MSEGLQAGWSEFEELRRGGQEKLDAGRFEEAFTLFDRALSFARSNGDARLVELAVCNRAAVAIELGRGESELPRLREILMHNSDAVNCRIAAYNIARFYELAKSYKKALFYARISRERSEILDRLDWLASSHNLIGNTLLAESYVEQATSEYERALELMPEEPSIGRGMILDNLGYCRVLQKRFDEGFSLLHQSLQMLRLYGPEEYQIPPSLDLCFAHLETGRYGHALRHGARALKLSDRLGEPDFIKNALYLLGEVENMRGNVETARAYFSRLQRDYYPDAGYLPGFLLAVDVRKLVNLHA